MEVEQREGESTKMAKEKIRDEKGMILGFIDTDSNGNTKVTNFQGFLLGGYDSRLNVTRRASGWIIGKGNQSSRLIYENIAEEQAKKSRRR